MNLHAQLQTTVIDIPNSFPGVPVALDSRSAPPSIGGAVLDRDDRLGPTSIS